MKLKIPANFREKRFFVYLSIILISVPTCTMDINGNLNEDKINEAIDSELKTNSSLSASCNSDPVIMKTSKGVEFVRTPDDCFADINDFPYKPKYVVINGLQQAYVDEGPEQADPVLLLHGQPSWSYLYRKMIPVLVNAGHRVIAMDHLGLGRSDKPIDIRDYSYVDHVKRLEKFIENLNLKHITLFCQDWGSLIGLNVAGNHPEWFDRIVVGDGNLPVIPAGYQVFAPVEKPDEIDQEMKPVFAGIPDQQPDFFDKEGNRIIEGDPDYFSKWMAYAMKAAGFHPAEVVEAMTYFPIPPEVEAAYDAPFPKRIYMAGIRVFPSLANELVGNTDSAWMGLTRFTKPFLTIWANNDPGQLGSKEVQQRFIDNVPGAAGQPHTRLSEASHFLQDDQGEEIARRINAFIAANQDIADNITAVDFGPIVPFESKVSKDGNMYERRYCEVLLAYLSLPNVTIEVYNTADLNVCPQDQWEQLDPVTLAAESNARAAILNGPRYWILDSIIATASDNTTETILVKSFGAIDMRKVAALIIPALSATSGLNSDYKSNTVKRDTIFQYFAGRQVYQLMDPNGNRYIMQSYSQIVDSELQKENLPGLARRLHLPAGWKFEVKTLETQFDLEAENGETKVVQDDLKNTYQKVP